MWGIIWLLWMLSNTHPGALYESGWESPRCSPFVAVNQICGIKRCLFFCGFAFILILRDEAMHQEDIVYLSVTLAFCTDSWGHGVCWAAQRFSVHSECGERRKKRSEVKWFILNQEGAVAAFSATGGDFLTTSLLINNLKNLNQKFDQRCLF